MKRYERFIGKYTKLGKKVSDLTRIAALMNAVGDPQERLRFVHIAGTNGKGSIAEMTARALTAAGYRTGLFTSPYIIRYNDRIRVDGREITDGELDALADITEPAAEGLSELGFSQFEITQAMAMLHYERCGCDIVVLETGLGGALDSTNIIPPPLVSVIGSVSFDHTAILGDTLGEIAAQKAGILKPGVPVVCVGDEPEVRETVRRTAEEKNCPFYAVDRDSYRDVVQDAGDASAPELTDYAIHERRALMARHSYLLRMIRELDTAENAAAL